MTSFFIRNKSERGLDRRLVEVDGLSTKRDDLDATGTIGHKGSGKMLSAVAALRAGITTGITSCDELGSYFLELDTEPLQVGKVSAQQVVFHYYHAYEGREDLGTTRKLSNRCLDSFAEWDHPIGDDDKKLFKVLREHVIDAYDADKFFTWGVCEGREFSAPDETCVYLEWHREFEAMLDAPMRYFKFLSRQKPIVELKGGQIWPKSQDGTTRLFLLGVLAYCSRDDWTSSVYDYSLDDKKLLSEDRTLKSVMSYQLRVAKLFEKLEHAGLCTAILGCVANGTAQFEDEVLGRVTALTDGAREAWLQALHVTYGEKPMLASASEVANSDMRQVYGYSIIHSPSSSLSKFLRLLGVCDTAEAFPKPSEQMDPVTFEQLADESRLRFRKMFALFAALYPDRTTYPIFFFRSRNEALDRFVAFAGHEENVFKQVWIQVKEADGALVLPNNEEIFTILVHETRHCALQVNDHERAFVRGAEADIVRLVSKLVKFADGKPSRLTDTGARPVPPTFGTLEQHGVFEQEVTFDKALRDLADSLILPKK